MKSIEVKIKASYRGFKIVFVEHRKEWMVEIGKERDAYSNTDLERVKDYVDKFLKSGFKPFEAFSTVGWGEKYRKVLVTSVDVEGSAWIQETQDNSNLSKRGSRSKVDKKDLIAITPENEAAIKAIHEIDTQTDKLHKEKQRLEKQLTHPEL